MFNCRCKQCESTESKAFTSNLAKLEKIGAIWGKAKRSRENKLAFECSGKYVALMEDALPDNYYQLVKIYLMVAREASEAKHSVKGKLKKEMNTMELRWRERAYSVASVAFGTRHPWTMLLQEAVLQQEGGQALLDQMDMKTPKAAGTKGTATASPVVEYGHTDIKLYR